MGDLVLGLLVLGVVLFAGVLVYNRLQERAVRRDTERSFAPRHADAPAPDARSDTHAASITDRAAADGDADRPTARRAGQCPAARQRPPPRRNGSGPH